MVHLHALCPASLALLEGAASTPSLGGSAGPDLTRYFVVCGVLLLAVAALALGFRKLVAGALRRRAAQRSMQVMDLLPLGGKQRLAVVRCYDRTFLVGLGDKEMCKIAELDAVIAPERETPATLDDLRTFSNVLARSTGAKKSPAAPAQREEGLFA